MSIAIMNFYASHPVSVPGLRVKLQVDLAPRVGSGA